MEIEERNRAKAHRGALALLAVLICLLSSCTPAEDTMGQSAGTSVSSEDTSETVSTAEETPEPEQNPMDDGKLRVISDYDSAQSVVFCGDQVVYDGKGIATLLEGEDTSLFSVRYNEGDQYFFDLYDAEGTAVLTGLTGYPAGIYGNWLLLTGYDQAGSDLPVYDVRTLQPTDQTLPSISSAYVVGDQLVVNYDNGMNLYALDDLTLLESYDGWYGVPLTNWNGNPVPEAAEDYVMMTSYNSDTGESFTRLYNPLTGVQYDNVDNYLGGLYLSVHDDDGYKVYDLSTGNAVASDQQPWSYYSDAVQIWRPGASCLISAPAYDGIKEVQYAYPSSDGQYIYVQIGDGQFDVLNPQGELLFSVTPEEGQTAYDIGGGMISLYNSTGNSTGGTGTAAYWPDGHKKVFPQYTNIIRFYGMDDLLLGSYQIGRSYLYDLLDGEGNVLLAGLKSYGTADSDQFIYAEIGFQKGYITLDGEWLWSRSVFQNTDAEPSYYW